MKKFFKRTKFVVMSAFTSNQIGFDEKFNQSSQKKSYKFSLLLQENKNLV